MYSLGITLHVKPDHIKAFIELSRALIVQTRMEPGCLWFDLLRSEIDRTVFTFYHAYASEADFQEHLTQLYVREWFRLVRPMLTARGIEFPSYYMVHKDL